MRTNTPAHLKHFDYLGFHRYSLTFCTDRRRPLFTDEKVVDLVRSQIVRAATSCEFTVIAYCFMPDHLHVLVHGESAAADCRRFIAAAKQYSGYHYAKKYSGRLWQRYGYERTLRTDEHTLQVAKYILENPVRANLAVRVQDYPFVGSTVCELKDLLLWIYAEVGQSRSG